MENKYEVPSFFRHNSVKNYDILFLPEERMFEGHDPHELAFKYGTAGYFRPRMTRRDHLIGWLQVIGTILGLIISIMLINSFFCAIAMAEEGNISFPSYWTYDESLVKEVQTALNEHGAELKVDGKFGPATGQAVKNFQLLSYMPVTGVIDDTVAKKLGLKEWEQCSTMYYMADLEKAYDKSDYEDLIYVSLGGRSGRSHLSLFRDGILIAETECITGDESRGHFTPLGVHSVSKKSKLREGAGYAYYNQLWLRVNGKASDYAIHSLLDFGNGETGNQDLGEHTSNGCIRVSNLLAHWLRENVQVGTIVVIDDRAFEPAGIGFESLVSEGEYADWD